MTATRRTSGRGKKTRKPAVRAQRSASARRKPKATTRKSVLPTMVAAPVVRKSPMGKAQRKSTRPAPGAAALTMSFRLPGNPYSVHPGVAMVQGWIASLKEKTGRSLEEWTAHIRAQQHATEAAAREWLKKTYGLGSNTVWWLAEKANPEAKMGITEDDPESYLKAAVQYVDEMFGATKSNLRPIYEELLRLGLSQGPDAKACPCKTIVPLYRRHVFAQIKPTTQTRIDLGLALAAHPDAATGKLPKRLIPTGGLEKKDRITHRIEIARLKDIDADVKKWLRTAYTLDS